MPTKKQNSPKGYTLIELIITLTIISTVLVLFLGCAGGLTYYFMAGG